MRPLVWPLLIATLAAAMYLSRIAREMPDFDVNRTAAVRLLDAEPLYRPADAPDRFLSLPVFAIAMAPLAILDAETAPVVWFAVSVGLLMALVRWSVSGLPARQQSRLALSWITVIFMGKFYAHELTLGQASILAGALLVAGLLAIRIDRPVAAAVLVSLAALLKPYALILVPWLVAGFGWRAAAVSAGVLFAGLVVPAAIYGWSGNLDLLAAWYATVTATTAPNLTSADNVSFAAMWAKWVGPGRAAAALAATTAVASLGVVVHLWRRRGLTEEPEYLEWSALMLLIPLLSPLGWDYVLLLATPAVVCLVDRWYLAAREWRAFIGASLALMGLTLLELMGRDLYARFMAASLVTVAALGVLACLVHLRYRQLA